MREKVIEYLQKQIDLSSSLDDLLLEADTYIGIISTTLHELFWKQGELTSRLTQLLPAAELAVRKTAKEKFEKPTEGAIENLLYTEYPEILDIKTQLDIVKSAISSWKELKDAIEKRLMILLALKRDANKVISSGNITEAIIY